MFKQCNSSIRGSVVCRSTDFRDYVKPFLATLIAQVRGPVPIIYFGTGNQHLLVDAFETGPDVMAFDWRTPLRATWDSLDCRAVQGNLDPIVLCGNVATIEAQAQRILDSTADKPGHIFNLGHGIVPTTPVEHVRRLVDYVHTHS